MSEYAVPPLWLLNPLSGSPPRQHRAPYLPCWCGRTHLVYQERVTS